MEPGDPARLATALGAAWSDDALHAQLVEAALERRATMRSWTDVAWDTRPPGPTSPGRPRSCSAGGEGRVDGPPRRDGAPGAAGYSSSDPRELDPPIGSGFGALPCVMVGLTPFAITWMNVCPAVNVDLLPVLVVEAGRAGHRLLAPLALDRLAAGRDPGDALALELGLQAVLLRAVVERREADDHHHDVLGREPLLR